jgi:CYTH domain-containing protein
VRLLVFMHILTKCTVQEAKKWRHSVIEGGFSVDRFVYLISGFVCGNVEVPDRAVLL